MKAILCLVLLFASTAVLAGPILPRDSIVDECCCSVATVVSENKHLHSLLDDLVTKTFFKYFKVNLEKDCPYWAVEHLCGLQGGCGVCQCDENEIPLPWKQEDMVMTDKVSTSTPQGFRNWEDRGAHQWTSPDGPESAKSYVVLTASPEGNTGYRDGKNIWALIYRENCFQGNLSDMCLEERVTYRLISGIHTSTNTHVCSLFEKDPATGTWKPNVGLFQQLVGKYPERVSNLYFTFVFMLRALNRASNFLREYEFNTGNPAEDAQVKRAMEELLGSPLICEPTFDDAMLFTGHEKADLKRQMRNYFRNISTLMDCVSCEKCKLWGKLQMLGLGTALKILIEDSEEVEMDLQRNEIVALINTLRQLSDSIQVIETLTSHTAPLPAPQKENLTSSVHHAALALDPVLVGAFFLGTLTVIAAMLLFVRQNNRKCETKQSSKKKVQ